MNAVNAVRAAGATCGTEVMAPAPALVLEERLVRAASAHSQDMAENGFMAHVGTDGSNPGERITREGYSFSTWGENVAWGYPTVERVMAGWVASAGHCKNIMNPRFTEFGAAEVDRYWTQVFARPRG